MAWSAQDGHTEEMPRAVRSQGTAMTIPKLISSQEAANKLGIKIGTLRLWRMQGNGPIYRKIGARVAYTEADVLAFIEGSARISTSQKAASAGAEQQTQSLANSVAAKAERQALAQLLETRA
jgi:predicted site-specific integrase-resolvase